MGKSSAPAPTPAPAPVVTEAPTANNTPYEPNARAVALRAGDQGAATKAADTITSGSGDVDPLTQKKQLTAGSTASMMG